VRWRWEQTSRFFALVYPETNATHGQLRAIVAACLQRVGPGLPPSVRALADALERGESLAEFAASGVLDVASAGAAWAQIPRFVTGLVQRAPLAELIETVRAVAEQCRGAVGDRAFPPRDLFSFSLPPELEPYRAETAARVAEDPRFGRPGWDESSGCPLPYEALDQSLISHPEEFPRTTVCHATASHLRQQRLAYNGERGRALETEELAQCDIARDVLGYPGAQVEFRPTWRTSTAVALVRAMYNSRDFSGMPILADALQEAGCENEDILTHCRSAGPHVRGCWCGELVLGAE
jgi:hypothetical protein